MPSVRLTFIPKSVGLRQVLSRYQATYYRDSNMMDSSHSREPKGEKYGHTSHGHRKNNPLSRVFPGEPDTVVFRCQELRTILSSRAIAPNRPTAYRARSKGRCSNGWYAVRHPYARLLTSSNNSTLISSERPIQKIPRICRVTPRQPSRTIMIRPA
jgi:hypothetical protein